VQPATSRVDSDFATSSVRLSVVVPVYNDRTSLARCLAALGASAATDVELIVVDDASTDDSAAVAVLRGARVLRLTGNAGPAAARNHGARQARGAILFFVDADVVVAPGALERVIAALSTRPDVAAVFGSYDADPPAGGIISRYKNLLHHFVHQAAAVEASTFWAGCGAIRRAAFEDIGGFDERRFRRPSIEDIDLGYRLRRAGYRILLDKGLQATHLKRWTFASLVRTDVMSRALPWSRLILESGVLVDDLNLSRDQRLSAVLVVVAAGCLALAPFRPALAAVSAGALLGVGVLNRRLYAFFARRGGLLFAAACVLLHWLYFLYSGLTYMGVWTGFRLKALASRARSDRQ
jgi:GT2 family glycosyltransferase